MQYSKKKTQFKKVHKEEEKVTGKLDYRHEANGWRNHKPQRYPSNISHPRGTRKDSTSNCPRNSDSKIKIFKHRSKNDVKKQLTMHEDITHQNAVLLQLLNNEFKAPDITTENICVRYTKCAT